MSNAERPQIVTLTNYGYRELTLNLYLSMQAIGMTDTLHIGCIDPAACAWLRKRAPRARVFLIDNPITERKWVEFEGPGWPQVTFNKFKLIHPILKSGRSVLFLDGDIVLLRDPVPGMVVELGDREAVFQDDSKEGVHDELCTGCFLVRPSPRMCAVFDPGQIPMEGFRDDQKHINQHRDRIHYARLSALFFPVGWRIVEHPDPAILLASASLLHFNWCVGANKIRWMTDMGLWRVEREPERRPLRIAAFP